MFAQLIGPDGLIILAVLILIVAWVAIWLAGP